MAEELEEEDSADPKAPQTWLTLASDKLENARRIFAIELYDETISNAYYAMYYAAKAALLSKGLDLRKHSSAALKFQELFVVTGHVDAEYARYLSRARVARERSDYDPLAHASRDDAQKNLEIADTFIAKIKELLTS